MANISPDNHELLSSLVQRSLGLLSEIHEIEKRMRQLMAEITIAGIDSTRISSPPRETALPLDPVNRGSMRWSRRD